MVLGIVLCGNIQFVIMLLFILMAVDVPIKGPLFAFFVGLYLYVLSQKAFLEVHFK